MFPLEFDRRILDTLPLPDEEGVQRVARLLRTIMNRRVLPHFKRKRGTDVIVLARVDERLTIERFEDELGRVSIVSMIVPSPHGWTLRIHERIVDYLAFVIPDDPNARLADGTTEERKMLAFAEVLLRHEIEHVLYPGRSEREIVLADAEFAMNRRQSDPTFYRAFRQALDDEMNGLRGARWTELLDQAEHQRPLTESVSGILNDLVKALGDVPFPLLREVFPQLGQEMQTRVLGECFRRSGDASDSLVRRADCLRTVLALFDLLLAGDDQEGRRVFDTFKERWGLVVLFREVGISETSVEEQDSDQLFDLFRSALEKLADKEKLVGPASLPAPEAGKLEAPAAKPKGLRDRIDEVRSDPGFPRRVLEVIDKNKVNAVGHSGAKYSELIETLLAVPWGKIHRIRVSPQDFEAGLDRTHYGLKQPKERVCDFFTNLIWRHREHYDPSAESWRRAGSAFLFVGPPGVGKTSFAISIARNLEIPYHKFSLGGMRDEADIRGHGFTYEGSKPGAIVQGLIKMGVMNGMFILDEADKTGKFAIATLLEILDPEQNHLFHDKFTQTTVDIDISNCHFVLTANTLETVPPPVIDRCEVVMLDRYSVEEKVAIARQFLIGRIRDKYRIAEDEIAFDAELRDDLLRYLIKSYTYEAGVRQLERTLRTLFLRLQRKEILAGERPSIRITREHIKRSLVEPRRPRQINDADCVGETLALGVDVDRGVGSIIPIQATPIRVTSETNHDRTGPLSVMHATGNIEKIMDESRKVATTGILSNADALAIDTERVRGPIHLHFMGGSTPKDGPSAGGAIALALASALSGRSIRRDVAMTGEIDTHGRITAVGGLDVKLETAFTAGCKTVIVPEENLRGVGGLERLPDALRDELHILTYGQWKAEGNGFDYSRHVLQVVGVDHVVQAAEVACIEPREIAAVEARFVAHAAEAARNLRNPVSSVIQIKRPEELAPPDTGSAGWEEFGSATLLMAPEVARTFRTTYPDLPPEIRVRELRLPDHQLASIVRELAGSQRDDVGALAGIVLVAPFFFLKRDGIVDELSAFDPPAGDLHLCANNYTVQGVKIKGAKALLNRVYCRLARMGPDSLETCPFLGRTDGVHAVDLSVIPEKYRLDVKRTETILSRCLTQWLARA